MATVDIRESNHRAWFVNDKVLEEIKDKWIRNKG